MPSRARRGSFFVLFLPTIIIITGCEAPNLGPRDQKAETTSSQVGQIGGFREPFTTARAAKVTTPIPSEIDIQPTNGAVFKQRSTKDLAVTFTGFTERASQSVEVQVLSQPNAPITETSWVTIATTSSAAAPTTFNGDAASPIFRYSVIATPAPSNDAIAQDRWERGGLLRFRVIATDADKKVALPYFDSVAGDCIAKLGAKPWKETLAKCKSPFSPDFGAPTSGQVRPASLVSISSEPGNAFFPPPYLNRKGAIFQFETDNYYRFINAPRTLNDFQFRFGFFDRRAQPGSGSEAARANEQDSREAESIYYNLGDLGIGREMHCKTFRGGTACYVRNYGVDFNNQPNFSGDPGSALSDAVNGFNSFATVAMVKFGTGFAPKQGNDVQFFVYNAQDNLANLAQLDSIGFNQSIPNNCLNCHGGQYDRRSLEVTGASFLPFDPDAFLFSTRRGLTYDDQEDQIRELNVLVKNAGAPPATAQFIDGIYGGKAEIPGTKADLDFTPPGWGTTDESKTVYREVFKPFCRTCHVSQVGDFAFIRYEDFLKENAKTAESVCKTNEMPIAEATLSPFWRSPARAYVVGSLGLATSCAPR